MNYPKKVIITTNEYREQHRDQIRVIGNKAQQRLWNACVHVAALGGIGSQVAMELAAAGVGRVTANDPQRLDLSNLNRWPIASCLDLGTPKVDLLRSFLRCHPGVEFDGVPEPTESALVMPFLTAADLIVCCSNTVPSKVAAVEAAIRTDRPLIDVAVGDGRSDLTGAIRLYDPRDPEAACPACLATLQRNDRPGEGLVSTIIATTAALATHFAISLIASGGRLDPGTSANLIIFHFDRLEVEYMRVRRRPDCSICDSTGRVSWIARSGSWSHGDSEK